MEDKIKQENGTIGRNIRRLRKEQKIGQTGFVAKLQLREVNITRDSLIKIEKGIQHITLSQLKGIRDELNVSYEDLLDEHE